jgi:hypothetical protein
MLNVAGQKKVKGRKLKVESPKPGIGYPFQPCGFRLSTRFSIYTNFFPIDFACVNNNR